MHYSRNINILRYDILAKEIKLLNVKIELINELVKELNTRNDDNNHYYSMSEGVLEKNPRTRREIEISYIDPSSQLEEIISDKLANPKSRKNILSYKEKKFVVPEECKFDKVTEFYKDCTKMLKLVKNEYISYIKICQENKKTLKGELDHYKKKIVNPDYPEETVIESTFYERLFAQTNAKAEISSSDSKKLVDVKKIDEDIEKLREKFAKYKNPEEIPDGLLDKIIYRDLSKLKKTSGGLLTDLCKDLAINTYELQEGKPLKKIYEKIICAEIIMKGYKTSPGSVGSTLRKELGFKKS